ncbi:beta-hexosaminidase [Bacterioplanes sanyensis]|uniref:beta-N-acetylhexosaminidase n=1 Tax=Bacterioplanes sanyensis TaxID=1249553 RepID=UPI00167553C4|nr:beta-N-acetylhexosaminidase [Bacterioplanes sanyensis]GGY33080.1 beta-hexosaminidase [Bacterioplanes sanyensis]
MSQPELTPDAVGVVADLQGPKILPSEHALLAHPCLSGLILFARNYQNPQQLWRLTQAVRAVRPELLICIDQEGGRVQRCREGFTRLPPMLSFESAWLRQPEQTLALVRDAGWLMAVELLACGVDLSFAPVLDIDYGCSQVIGDRAFGRQVSSVVALTSAWVDGMKEAGMAATGKHFPGHGGVVGDSHTELPRDARSWPQLEQDLQPFKQLIDRGVLEAIMPAHVIYPALDAHHTAGFSSLWLQGMLRQQLGFTGIIFSDDLSMAGAAAVGGYGERARQAMAAGANALLACNDPDGALQVLETVRQSDQPPLALQSLRSNQHCYQMAKAANVSDRADDIRARLQALMA